MAGLKSNSRIPKPKQQLSKLTHELAELINGLLLRGPAGGKSKQSMSIKDVLVTIMDGDFGI